MEKYVIAWMYGDVDVCMKIYMNMVVMVVIIMWHNGWMYKFGLMEIECM